MNPDKEAIICLDKSITYGDLNNLRLKTTNRLIEAGVSTGMPAILRADYSPLSIATLMALIEIGCIIIPLTQSSYEALEQSINDVFPQILISISDENLLIAKLPQHNVPSLYLELHNRKSPGLVLFTSGSSGKPKAVVHDFSKLLEKFIEKRPSFITLNFLLFDHWGGLNTLLYGLSNMCLIVIPTNRSPEYICNLISSHKVELLPATPSFLNMILLSKAYVGKDFKSLRLITYGAETMPESTLKNLRKNFPDIELRQTYGMIEVGVLRAKSKSPDSLWIKLGGDGYKLRVVDNKLQIKATSAMLGYLNAETPFTEDGYMITGDLVEVDGEWIKILGRDSDLINVGGQKVYPAEVEEVLLECPELIDAVVFGEKNTLLGMVVCANIILDSGMDEAAARIAIRKYCVDRMQPYMVPVKFNFVNTIEQSSRLKRVRRF
nr:long-chain fatty acid--CoA ligase [Polynucleobacter hallstattensis]